MAPAHAARPPRRSLLLGGLAAVGVAAGAGVAAWTSPGTRPSPGPTGATGTPSATPTTSLTPSATPSPTPTPRLFSAPSVVREPGPDGVITELPKDTTNLMAWTVDDGTSAEVIGSYIDAANRTGLRLTFFANADQPAWAEVAPDLIPLLRTGQIQMGNHTWKHVNLRALGAAGIRDALQRNEDRLGELFDVSTKPWYRPPFGYQNPAVRKAAGEAGWTATALWYGSLADSGILSPEQVLENGRTWFLPGHVVIGHLNLPAVTQVMDDLIGLLSERSLTPVTLADVWSG